MWVDARKPAVDALVRHAADRVLDGSDVAGRSFASHIGRVLGTDISLASPKLILRNNFQ